MNLEPTLEVQRTETKFTAADLDHSEWERARAVYITRYWSGEEAPIGRHAEARALWSDEAFGVRFICRQAEPLVVNASPHFGQKTIGLWERDVCEIFIAPDARTPEKYFEFEVAPTGEWLDLAIYQSQTTRETDWQYQSGMTAAARISEDSATLALRVSWNALGRPTPREGERWRINLFRCVGAGAGRGYLAWQPTRTAQPNFHVPKAFGWLHFKRRTMNDER